MSEPPPPVITPGNIGLNPYRLKRTNRLESAGSRTKRKYQRQKQRKEFKKINKKATKYLKKAGYLDIDDAETVNYSNDTNIDDAETIDYNNDNKPSNLDKDIQKVALKKKSASILAKKILTKYKNLKRKTTLRNYEHLNKDNDDVVFIKQVPVHPKNRMKKLPAQNDKVEFIKQVSLHPRLHLKRKATLNNYRLLHKKKSKSDGDNDVIFIKKVLLHPRDRMKRLLAENDKVEFIKQVPLYPRGRLGRATKRLKEVQFIKQVPTHL